MRFSKSAIAACGAVALVATPVLALASPNTAPAVASKVKRTGSSKANEAKFGGEGNGGLIAAALVAVVALIAVAASGGGGSGGGNGGGPASP